MPDEFHQVTIRGDADRLRKAADAVDGKMLRVGVRGFVIPDSAQVYSAAIDNGAVATLHTAGFTICSAGGPEPALAKGETAAEGEDLPALLAGVVVSP